MTSQTQHDLSDFKQSQGRWFLPVPKVPDVGELGLDQGVFWVEDLEHGDGLER